MNLNTLSFLLLFWTMGLLACCTILHLWFSTTLPVEIAIILREIGVIKEAATILPNAASLAAPKKLEDLTRNDFDDWLMLLETGGKVGRRFAHIMRCRGCFSVYASVAGALAVAGILSLYFSYMPSIVGWVYLPVLALLTWPWLACKLTAPKPRS